MPLIGPLLDAWDGVPNDIKSAMREDFPSLCIYLNLIDDAMCIDFSDQLAATQPDGDAE